MGYTNYWNFNFKAGKAQDLEVKYQKAILECQRFVFNLAEKNRKELGSSGLAGYTAHCKPGIYAGLLVNGAKEEACEDFVMREHLKQNDKSNWCKTDGNYYTFVVEVCLLILKYRLQDAIQLTSDGDESDWLEASEQASKFLRRKVIVPDTIRPTYAGIRLTS